MAYQSEIEKLEARYRENPQQWFAALADSYRKAGDLDLALDVVRAGLEKRPNYVSGHIVLGRCLLDQKNDQEAAQAFRRVLELDAENVIALRALADISRRAGDREGTRRWLNRLLEVDPMNEEAKQELEALEAEAAAAPETLGVAEEVASQPPVEPETGRLAGLEPTAMEVAGPAETAEPAPVGEPGEVEAAASSDLEEAVELGGTEEAALGLEAAVQEGIGSVERTAAEVGEAASGKVSESAITPEPGVVELEPEEEVPAAGQAPQMGETSPVEQGEEPQREAELAIEKAEEATLGELETMEFVAPSEEEVTGAAAPGEDLMPFDESLAWGAGERMSRAIDSETLEAALEAREESLAPPEALLEEGAVSTDLPLILPEEVEKQPSQAAAGGETTEPEAEEAEQEGSAAAEPVVTETMAELYAKQGLVTQARDIYRKLVAQRPQDARLAGRLAELERAALGEAVEVKPGKIPLASATGGESVRDFLARVLGGDSESAEPTVGMDNPAAGAGGVGEAPVEISGSPTRAAEDEISLAQIFGEEPAPLNPKRSEPRSSRNSGFSFDEFFGTGGESKGGESGGGGEEGDDFTRWLKSLKS
ncbi:Lipopolysaccharide assembly protein B [bacterium HR33]|nr:Lipopolysaccharide assembly protein B [bacterium HR33]